MKANIYILLSCMLFIFSLANGHPFQQSSPKEKDHSVLIVGGRDAKQGEAPYQIEIRYGVRDQHKCGGSLIQINETQFVLTSAACLFATNHRDCYLVAGDIKLSDRTDLEQYRTIKSMYEHENYRQYDDTDDIAILALDSPFEINEHVAPINLPKRFQETTGTGVISGWGVTDHTFRNQTDHLQIMTMPIIPDKQCAEEYRGDRLTEKMICAGQEDDGICTGDTGGPLKSSSGNYLAGIASWGGPCGFPYINPSVFTKVSHYIDWIEEKAAILSRDD